MKRTMPLLAAGLSIMLYACTSGMQQETDTARGAELLTPFKQDLKLALTTGMQKGPLNAISVCKDEAPAIAASLSSEEIQMGRTSHRLRNPDNSAPEWVDAALQSYLDEDYDRTPRLVPLQNGRVGYVEAIETQPLCLACHGNVLAPEVAAHIEGTYPNDEATGFGVGDLRGVFWVEYPKAE